MNILTKEELKLGMILGEAVICQNNVLYPADTIVDKKVMDDLDRYAIGQVTVKEASDFASGPMKKICFSGRFKEFEEQYNQCLLRYKGVMLSFMGTHQPIRDHVLLEIYNEVYEKISTGSELLNFIYSMAPNEDELTYTQGLNSALLAGAFADWLSMNDEDKNILVLCGFYYDIGKWTLPYDILWKPGKLTDEEFAAVQKHPMIGYELVFGQKKVNEHVKNAVIMHHERLDGSGYPNHLKGNDIDIFARYIAIVDAYIAMASPRTYREAFTPLQILGNFEKSMDKYDVALLMPIMQRIADAQIGTKVQLNDDSIWEVLLINPIKFSRPVLKNDKNGFLDLYTHPQLEIVRHI